MEVGHQEEKVALASRARLQENFTKDVIETTRCQVSIKDDYDENYH